MTTEKKKSQDFKYSFRKAGRLGPSEGAGVRVQGTLSLEVLLSWPGGAIEKNQGVCAEQEARLG